MDPKRQHLHNATLQRQWAADAFRDAQYNQNRAAEERAKGNNVIAREYMQEAGFDKWWGARRVGWAKGEAGKGKR